MWRRWKPVLVFVALAASVAFASAAVLSFAYAENQRRDAQAQRRVSNARSIVDTCQQVEAVKTALRGTIEASLAQLPTLGYYKARPEELAQAQKSARLSLARFTETDCYALPIVRSVGLRPPHNPAK
jgi:Na+-transporting NADH:ubiquinone oxidoreductase subunit NqrC